MLTQHFSVHAQAVTQLQEFVSASRSTVKMADDSWKTQRIQDHFVVLCNELDVDRISPVLRQEGMLTADEFEQLTNQLFTTQNRRQKLLLFIPRKGRTHFEKFCECLVWSGQTELARKIGVPVEKIPPSPHPCE